MTIQLIIEVPHVMPEEATAYVQRLVEGIVSLPLNDDGGIQSIKSILTPKGGA